MNAAAKVAWPDQRISDLLGIDLPILQAPMAGSALGELAVAVAHAGGLGALACAMLSADQVRKEVAAIRSRAPGRPLNLNFFCHAAPRPDALREERWRTRLAACGAGFGVEPSASGGTGGRAPFDEVACTLVEELSPEVVSFHFGLPPQTLLDRVRNTGAKILSTATTVAEARWLEEQGCHAIIAQGIEAGGHRGMFLTDDLLTQSGTMALVPAVVDAVRVPVIAAGGIGDARGIAAALALGAAAVQLGTAYLCCPEAATAPLHRAALREADKRPTALTNVITGRPARGLVNRIMRELGPIAAEAPDFPLPAAMLAPLRAKAESMGSEDFSPLWAGQAAAMTLELPAGELTRLLAEDAWARLAELTAPIPR